MEHPWELHTLKESTIKTTFIMKDALEEATSD